MVASEFRDMAAENDQSLAGKRILFFIPEFELGGAERQALHLARYLKAEGCDIHVWANFGSGLAAEQCEEAGIPWSVQPSLWPCRKSRIPRNIFRFLGMVRRLRKLRPDLLIAYTPRPCVACGLTWKWSGAKAFIWSQRDVDDLQGDLIEKIAYRRASAVICNAGHEREYLDKTLGKTSAPTHVVYNGSELDPPLKSAAEWREELGLSEADILAVMVANFRYQKDHFTLLKAWKEVMDQWPSEKGKPLLLLAGVKQEAYEDVEALAADLNLLDTILMPGQVKDISGLLSAADIGILSTHHEGLPNAIIEYMLSGLPVVGTDIPAVREVCGAENERYLYPPEDANKLAELLRKLMLDAQLREHVGAENRKRALREFSLETMRHKSRTLIAAALQ